MCFLSVDVGTTCIKYGVYSQDGEAIEYNSNEYKLTIIDGENYVDIDKIRNIICEILASLSQKYKIKSISFSCIGESFVLLDRNDKIIFYPMLYSDNRGEVQAKKICENISEKEYFNRFGVVPHSMYSISKLLYIKENYPAVFEKADKLMLVGDYLGYVLTGKNVIDYSLAARTGIFDIEKKEFAFDFLELLGINSIKLSTPKPTGVIVGDIKKEYGLDDAVLVLGSHDQVCATLGAGVFLGGEAADGMGTVECITAVFNEKPCDYEMGKMGYPCVPFLSKAYCTYILNFSCGGAVNFLKNNVACWDKEKKGDFFKYMEENMVENPSSIFTLPYFSGAGTPYQDNNASGAFLGLKSRTNVVEIYQSIIESTAYEMKLNMDVVKNFGIEIKKLVATGGGSKSNKWLQKKANIQQIPVKQLKISEGGLCGLAILQSVALKSCENFEEAKAKFVKYGAEFLPVKESLPQFKEKYLKYKKIYKTLKKIY